MAEVELVAVAVLQDHELHCWQLPTCIELLFQTNKGVADTLVLVVALTGKCLWS